MDDAISAVILLLAPFLVNNGGDYKSVLIANDVTILGNLKGNHLPLISVSPMGEDTANGPFANTARRTFRMRIRTWQKSWKPETAITPGSERDLYAVSDQMRILLNSDKALQIAGPLDFQYYRNLQDNTIDVSRPFTKGIGELVARDMTVSYWRLEDWTGPINQQAGLVTPPA